MFNSFDMRMFKAARSEADKSEFDPFHLGCVIVYKKNIISRGWNKAKTHPMQRLYNKYRKFNNDDGTHYIIDSVHAEIDAISKIPYTVKKEIDDNGDWHNVKIYVYRKSNTKRSKYSCAKPCKACMNAIKDLGITDVYYTDWDGLGYLKIGGDIDEVDSCCCDED